MRQKRTSRQYFDGPLSCFGGLAIDPQRIWRLYVCLATLRDEPVDCAATKAHMTIWHLGNDLIGAETSSDPVAVHSAGPFSLQSTVPRTVGLRAPMIARRRIE